MHVVAVRLTVPQWVLANEGVWGWGGLALSVGYTIGDLQSGGTMGFTLRYAAPSGLVRDRRYFVSGETILGGNDMPFLATRGWGGADLEVHPRARLEVDRDVRLDVGLAIRGGWVSTGRGEPGVEGMTLAVAGRMGVLAEMFRLYLEVGVSATAVLPSEATLPIFVQLGGVLEVTRWVERDASDIEVSLLPVLGFATYPLAAWWFGGLLGMGVEIRESRVRS